MEFDFARVEHNTVNSVSGQRALELQYNLSIKEDVVLTRLYLRKPWIKELERL